jgi:hypothetical protein
VPAAARSNHDPRRLAFSRWKVPDYASDGEHGSEVRAKFQDELGVNRGRSLIRDCYALVQAAVDVTLTEHPHVPSGKLECQPTPFATKPDGSWLASIQEQSKLGKQTRITKP